MSENYESADDAARHPAARARSTAIHLATAVRVYPMARDDEVLTDGRLTDHHGEPHSTASCGFLDGHCNR